MSGLQLGQKGRKKTGVQERQKGTERSCLQKSQKDFIFFCSRFEKYRKVLFTGESNRRERYDLQ